MNLDELRTVQSKERRKDSLQHLRDSFYEDVADYVAGLKSERKEAAAAAADPFSSPEVSRLTDEIETAEEVVEAVYERRVGKVVKLASFAAADMPVDEDGMTTQERDLFEDLVARIEENKTTVLDVLAGDASPESGSGSSASAGSRVDPDPDPDPDPGPASAAAGSPSDRTGHPDPVGGPGNGVDTDPSATAQDASDAESGGAAGDDAPDVLSQAMNDDREITVGDGSDESGSSAGRDPDVNGNGGDPAPDTDRTSQEAPPAPPEASGESGAEADSEGGVAGRTTVRITRDVGSILGVDEREYELAEEDVVTLPTANADPLVKRDAAERID
jgi:DNA replication factor GINS